MPNAEGDINVEILRTGRPLIVAFGGVNQGMGMPVFEFFNMLNAYEVSKVFVRDIQQVWYHKGAIEGKGSMIHTKSAIEHIIKEAKPSKVIFIGNSAGGYAAILFGRWLQVDEVHAFSPQSFIGLMKKLWHNDKRWLLQIVRAHLYFSSFRSFFDLKSAFEKIQNTTTRFTIYYPKDHRLDALHAERLSTFANVKSIGYSDVGHELISVLKKTGELKEILSKLT